MMLMVIAMIMSMTMISEIKKQLWRCPAFYTLFNYLKGTQEIFGYDIKPMP